MRTESEIELKPCPFCGKAAKLQQGLTWLIGCDTRGCIGYRPYSLDRDYETAHEAVSAWNRRLCDE
jgi:ssDNA-binding Zn-finger/Zn-ribbon topoisomerase 1